MLLKISLLLPHILHPKIVKTKNFEIEIKKLTLLYPFYIKYCYLHVHTGYYTHYKNTEFYYYSILYIKVAQDFKFEPTVQTQKKILTNILYC